MNVFDKVEELKRQIRELQLQLRVKELEEQISKICRCGDCLCCEELRKEGKP